MIQYEFIETDGNSPDEDRIPTGIIAEVAKALCKSRNYTVVCNLCPPDQKCLGIIWRGEAKAAIDTINAWIESAPSRS